MEIRLLPDDGRNLPSVLVAKLAIPVIAMPILGVAERTKGDAATNRMDVGTIKVRVLGKSIRTIVATPQGLGSPIMHQNNLFSGHNRVIANDANRRDMVLGAVHETGDSRGRTVWV
jgi:hypothetical protein